MIKILFHQKVRSEQNYDKNLIVNWNLPNLQPHFRSEWVDLKSVPFLTIWLSDGPFFLFFSSKISFFVLNSFCPSKIQIWSILLPIDQSAWRVSHFSKTFRVSAPRPTKRHFIHALSFSVWAPLGREKIWKVLARARERKKLQKIREKKIGEKSKKFHTFQAYTMLGIFVNFLWLEKNSKSGIFADFFAFCT